MAGRLEISGLEDYWVVSEDGKIVDSFSTEEEAVEFCDRLEAQDSKR